MEWNALLVTPSPTEQDVLSTPEPPAEPPAGESQKEEHWLTSDIWCKLGHLQTTLPRAFGYVLYVVGDMVVEVVQHRR